MSGVMPEFAGWRNSAAGETGSVETKYCIFQLHGVVSVLFESTNEHVTPQRKPSR